jgi:hypothetical protein
LESSCITEAAPSSHNGFFFRHARSARILDRRSNIPRIGHFDRASEVYR